MSAGQSVSNPAAQVWSMNWRTAVRTEDPLGLPQARRMPRSIETPGLPPTGRLLGAARPAAVSGDPWLKDLSEPLAGLSISALQTRGPLRGRGSLLPKLSRSARPATPGLLCPRGHFLTWPLPHETPGPTVRVALRSPQHPLPSLPQPHPRAHG